MANLKTRYFKKEQLSKLEGKNQEYKCEVCGEFHAGVYSSRVCADCYKKGL